MKLDDIPAEAWRRAVEELAEHVQNCGHMLNPEYADGVRDATEKIQEKARRIAAEMAEPGTPPNSENGGG